MKKFTFFLMVILLIWLTVLSIILICKKPYIEKIYISDGGEKSEEPENVAYPYLYAIVNLGSRNDIYAIEHIENKDGRLLIFYYKDIEFYGNGNCYCWSTGLQVEKKDLPEAIFACKRQDISVIEVDSRNVYFTSETPY